MAPSAIAIPSRAARVVSAEDKKKHYKWQFTDGYYFIFSCFSFGKKTSANTINITASRSRLIQRDERHRRKDHRGDHGW